MLSFEDKLNNYAELAVRIGANVQPGQTLVVSAAVDAISLVRLIVRKAYEAGAKFVKVNYTDEVVTRLRYDLAPEDSFTLPPTAQAREWTELAEEDAAFLTVISANPDLLKGVNPYRISALQSTFGKAMSTYRHYQQSHKMSWTGIAFPSADWAAKVFPDAPAAEQVSLLWDAIFKAVRADVADPIQAWHEHTAQLQRKSDELNAKKYQKLRFQSPGTDLTVALPEGHIWAQAGSTNEKGVPFVANIPTEEVFTAPLKTGVDGYVTSTKPLSYGGTLIDNFKLTFENGRIVSYSAEQGEETLARLIEMDEGSHYLGEVALVPYHSPISQSNILYLTTLFDENASCHLAIGSAYAFNLEGGKTMSSEELAAHGLNASITHVDFMMGHQDTRITGIKQDGTEEAVFNHGDWA